MKLKKPNTIVRAVCAGAGLTLCCLVPVYATGGDPLTIVNNLSDFIFSVIKAIGIIILGWGIVQVGMSIQSHDASSGRRACCACSVACLLPSPRRS